jgi:hypothetical protein
MLEKNRTGGSKMKKKIIILVIELLDEAKNIPDKDIEAEVRHELKLRPTRVPHAKKLHKVVFLHVPDLNFLKRRSKKNKCS